MSFKGGGHCCLAYFQPLYFTAGISEGGGTLPIEKHEVAAMNQGHQSSETSLFHVGKGNGLMCLYF